MKPIFACALAFGALAFAGEDHHAMGPTKGSAALERVKLLAGTWEGKDPMSKDGAMMTVEYRVTANGSAVEERLHAGTPTEMVTMYYDHGGTLQLTHYCTLGNHPGMKLKASDPTKLDFGFVDGSVAKADEMHMHALVLTTPDKDHLMEEWTLYQGGKPEKDKHVMSLTRKKI